ncbi:uncharacterized protein LOC141906078 [Tubulanus polymorphus]|uniref:uncharacterized protein LOC141906078 n=1 Tax=Tubulanus polymorphus TaxID=672921 RepID=UPI003DA226F4
MNAARFSSHCGRTGFRQEEFSYPWFIDTNALGDIAVADTDNHRVQVIDANNHLTIINPAGKSGHPGHGLGRLWYPRSVKFTPSFMRNCQLAVVDSGNRRVVMLGVGRPDGFLEEVVDMGNTYYGQPTDLVFDADRGFMFVTDTSKSKVFIHDSDGRIFSEVRPNARYPLLRPTGIAMDQTGRVFVSDTGNDRVQVYDRNGESIGCVVGTDHTKLSRPKGLCVDRQGRILIADEMNDRVMCLSSDLSTLTELVTGVPRPKGVAANNGLVVSTGDPYNFIKFFDV